MLSNLENKVGGKIAHVGHDFTGLKTETRRTRSLDEINENPDLWNFESLGEISRQNIFAATFKNVNKPSIYKYIKCPWGKTGDEIWVKETFHACKPSGRFPELTKVWYNYKAEHKDRNPGPMWPPFDKWKSPLLMPKEASRILLEITGIKIERLQNITEEGAIREGIVFQKDSLMQKENEFWFGKDKVAQSARDMYKNLWSNMHGKESWDKNVYIWVIEFKVKNVKNA